MLHKSRDYDKKIFRLLTVLNRLDAGEKLATRQLAEEFNISIRSVQRDLELLGRAGFLLTSPEKGTHAFEEGFSLKKMHLTNEEASLLTFLYEIAKSLGDKFEKSFHDILKKVIQKEYDSPFYAKIPQGIKLKADSPFTKELEEAIDNCQNILLTYPTPEKIKQYKLCPLKIIFYEGFWYLLSQVSGKDWILKFRIEKIKDLRVLDEYFEPPKNLQAMLDESVNIWFSECKNKEALLRIDKEVARFFKQKTYFPRQKIKKEHRDGSLLVETKFGQYEEIIHIIMHWLPHIVVITPKELKKDVKANIRAYLSKITT